MKKKQKILLIILSAIIVLTAAVAVTVNHFLSKINFDDGTLQTAETSEKGETEAEDDEISPDDRADSSELNKADKNIMQNLDDGKILYSKDVLNILLLGIDYGSEKYPYGRSDAMILLSVNKSTKKISIVSLSRAAYVNIPGYSNTRLSHAHGLGGASLAKRTVEENYKTAVDNYVSVTFSSFEKIIDIFGGVTVYLTSAEAGAMRNKLGSSSAGSYRLNGKNALEYVRIRSIDSDRARTARQRRLVLAFSKKLGSMSKTELLKNVTDVLPYLSTDFSKSEILSNAISAVSYLSWETNQYVIPHNSTSLTLKGGFEVLLLDWSSEIKYLHEILYANTSLKYKAS